jgi:hypothetical protein
MVVVENVDHYFFIVASSRKKNLVAIHKRPKSGLDELQLLYAARNMPEAFRTPLVCEPECAEFFRWTKRGFRTSANEGQEISCSCELSESIGKFAVVS